MPNMKEFNPQYADTLSEQITKFLANAIMEGQLKAGQRLSENELGREFRTSRGPIREAFRALEKNGLVSMIPRKGTYIRKVGLKDIEEVFPIIANLESLAARLAVAHMTVENTKAMEFALTRMRQAIKKKDLKSFLKSHQDFHKIFVEASRNDTLIRTIEILRYQSLWFRTSYLYIEDSFEYWMSVHREILDLFVKRQADRVETLVEEHVLAARARFIELFKAKAPYSAMDGLGSGPT